MSFEADPIPALKRQLATELQRVLAEHESWKAAYYMRVNRARVSELRRGIVDRFSLDTLIRFLERLRYDVTISVVRRRFDRRER